MYMNNNLLNDTYRTHNLYVYELYELFVCMYICILPFQICERHPCSVFIRIISGIVGMSLTSVLSS